MQLSLPTRRSSDLNAKSSGVIPFIKMYDTLINSIQQGGRRRSSQVISIQPWHLDIEAFMDLRETTGNAYFRTPSLNTKLWMPDELMRRIERSEEHTSELQSRGHLVCRLLLEKKNGTNELSILNTSTV